MKDGRVQVASEITSQQEEMIWADWNSRKDSYLNDPEMRTSARLAYECFDKIPDVLRGTMLATDLLFSGSSMEKMEGIYKGNMRSDFFNSAMADVAKAYIKVQTEENPRAKVRIIEIGAGTGGTTSMVLPELSSLQDHIQEYCFTDLSRAFLMHGEKEWGSDYPFFACKIWNIEKSLTDQGIEMGAYDIAFATNVLHATKDIRKTLRNTKAALKRNGLLILNEGIQKTIYSTIVFGLLDGWWLNEDVESRIPGSPFLTPESWEKALADEGFGPVFFPEREALDLGQQVLVASSDGVVRSTVSNLPTVEFPSAKASSSSQKTVAAKVVSDNIEESVVGVILDALCRTLEVTKTSIEHDVPFFDYGIDSILGISFIEQVNQDLGIKMNTTAVFDYTTVDRLANHIVKTYPNAIQTKLDTPWKEIQEKSADPVKMSLPRRIQHGSWKVLKSRERRSSFLIQQEDGYRTKHQDIAVIGLSGQFPGANNVDAFWQNLISGQDGVSEFPSNYLDQKRDFSSEKLPGKTYSKWGGVLEERDCFDPLFFNISPREAESMNPHQRLIMQEGWKGLEDAGYDPKSLGESQVGFFIGSEPLAYSGKTFTGTSEAIVASRLSYYLNLKGPAFVVNTACSSSGVSIHLACESLRNQESDIALAGGVFAGTNSWILVSLSQIEMLSPTGRCFAFDETADGIVLSEAVGIVVLKRLEEAISDGDNIYGIIKGSGVNQDGASNGITAPSGSAQELLITSIYRRYGINPEEISYMEAHGTGTKLGDPVEANALVRSFQQFTDRKGYCALGSAKAHVGHSSGAAGVVSLIKILLSLKYNQIPGLLHFKKLNPLIELENSPFYINAQTTEWKSIDGRPRMAALSSFGHSGTNAHLVVQEYISLRDRQVGPILLKESPVLIPLSAKTEESLQTYAKQLYDFLEKESANDSSNWPFGLADIAHTLQTGREAMNERVIFIAINIPDFMNQLKHFCAHERSENVWTGQQIEKNRSPDKTTGEMIPKWIAQGKLYRIAELWAHGFAIDWNLFYREERPHRISLPTYPFAKEHYWIYPDQRTTDQNSKINSRIHPLLHENTSTLREQRFRSTFTGEEFFLRDHKVKGLKLLPGVAYLEMAQIAIRQATEYNEQSIKLKNIVWARPIVVDGTQEVNIGLFPEENGEIAYDIYTEKPASPEEFLTHSRGVAILGCDKKIPPLDLDELQAKFNGNRFTPQECYEVFQATGIDHGPALQGLEKIYARKNEVLAKLALPSSVKERCGQFTLHPSLLDSALQASIGMALDEAVGHNSDSHLQRTSLPFALESVDIMNGCAESMWVWVRLDETAGYHSSDGGAEVDMGDRSIQSLDIYLCDDEGNMSVRMRGLSTRVLDGNPGEKNRNGMPGTLMLRPVWKEKPAIRDQKFPIYTDHRVFLCGLDQESGPFQGKIPKASFTDLKSDQQALEKGFEECSLQLFEHIQKMIKAKPKGNTLLQVLVPAKRTGQIFCALSGLLQTARLENPKLLGQLIAVSKEEKEEDLISKLLENSGYPDDLQIRYERDKRFVASLEEMTGSEKDPVVPWKNGGVYLITGGAGGLGLIFAKEIAQNSKGASLVLTGRSELSETKRIAIDAIASLGAHVEYRPADVSRRMDVETLVQEIQYKFGSLTGVIHAAGVIRDSFILKKTSEKFRQVLSPKVAGTVLLYESTKVFGLDFFVMFSSVAGVLGNTGQVDYSTANAFMDAFAKFRNSLPDSKMRNSRILSINWPLWHSGGMKVNDITEKAMSETMGMVAMESASGIRAFYRGLSFIEPQVMVVEGDLKKLRAFFNGENLESTGSTPKQLEEENGSGDRTEAFEEKAINYFKRQISKALKLPIQKIHADAPLEKYGIDSISIMDLNRELEKTFGSLSKTLFFEYQTIREISRYFIESHESHLSKILIPDVQKRITPNTSESAAEFRVAKESFKGSRPNRFGPIFTKPSQPVETTPLDIAIVGLSGMYPQARNLDEYWQNLRDGKDCITIIPKDRWDWREYYTEDRERFGFHHSKWGGFIEDVDKFDALFFNISPKEAIVIDPQERLFLEHVWIALEDAGIRREDLHVESDGDLTGQVGVYAGVMYGDYQLFGAEESLRGNSMTVGGSYASIANRVSYFLNLHGPSMTVDTMCSSSLTTLHLACQDLKHGRTDIGIAGGVNLTIHPGKYLMLSSGRVISPRGHCESFGEGGEGYIPAEGVGVTVLKRLADAERDRDHIYGVIKGSALNHGGKTNGYTVPNPNAQKAVISRALRESGIDVRTISYVEAHGTGTRLGDPIEIAGLSKAFGVSKEKQYCSLGSVKSNFGHCESAAGIAGVTKILLQMQQGQIVPSLHSKALNPNIDFANTPFVVNQKLRDWQKPIIADKEVPRIAGISSFGAGGSNAHMLIEEYLPDKPQAPSVEITSINPVLIVLSAKNQERLKAYAEKLLRFVQNKDAHYSHVHLEDLAYTLQVGRVALGERLGLIVHSMGELGEKLQSFLRSRDDVENLYLGQARRKNETLSFFSGNEEYNEVVRKWMKRKKLSKLLEIWVNGLNINWNDLYGEKKPHKISAPTYPFARERHWLETTQINATREADSSPKSRIHPLLHKNTSTLQEQRFRSTFTGEEFFLNDHLVQGTKLLPGVAYLEMAQKAIRMASEEFPKGSRNILLKNVVWSRPIAVRDKPQEINVGLFPEETGEVAYEIYSSNQSVEEDFLLHSQGLANFISSEKMFSLNLGELQKKFSQKSLNPKECYEAFKGIGIEYGPAHQGLEKIYIGDNEVLAKLTLPASVSETKNEFTLHPSLLDSALQAAIGIGLGEEAPQPSLPFGLERLEIMDGCVESMWAWVRRSEGKVNSNKTQKLDIDLYDDKGNRVVRMQGVSSRVLESGNGDGLEASGTLLMKPVWKESPVDKEQKLPDKTEHRVFLCGLNLTSDRLQGKVPDISFMDLKSDQLPMEQNFMDFSLQLFEQIQGVIHEKPAGNVLFQVLVPVQGPKQVFSALSSLLKTARLEHPRLQGQVIALGEEEETKDLITKLQENCKSPADQQIRYEGKKRFVALFEEVASSKKGTKNPWKKGGVYLITGGLGGLGLIFAKEIAHKVRGATLILTGRSELNKEKQNSIRKLEKLGAQVEYKSADVADKEEVEALVQEIQDNYGRLNGIIHGAGVIRDNFIIKKTVEEFRQVLLSKVQGTIHLDQATKGLKLDFFVLFSSGAGATGNAGQADYSTANAFMDAFAKIRNSLADFEKDGRRTLSINWPLWRFGGMAVSDAAVKMMKDSTGMTPMETSSGLAAFYQALSSNEPQVMVAEGLIKRMKRKLLSPRQVSKAKAIPSLAKTTSETDADHLLDKVKKIMMRMTCDLLKLRVEDLEIDVEFSEYGFDSITLTDFANRLNQSYGLDLTPMIFFEHPTIEGFAKYLAAERPGAFADHLSGPARERSVVESDDTESEDCFTRQTNRSRFVSTTVSSTSNSGRSEPIAIVGMSGRFPMARNLEEFWDNLAQGRDCIGEIPNDRWDWEKLYGDPQKGTNRTNIKWGGFIDGVDEFDPLFFGISPGEAELMDPQQRLLMTYVWLALEDGGYSGTSLSGSQTGIFIGTMNSGYSGLVADADIEIEGHSSTGLVPSVGPNRMSYFLNIHGPSEPIETACSSSLVAIHRALTAMETGGCDQAIVGGVNTIITQDAHISFSKAGMLCADGRCKTFSNRANGYVRAEGVGILFLKKLEAAKRDQDHIYGLIRGSAENHGGRANSLTAPNPKAQSELLVSAYKKSGLDPRTVGYIEAHGTGTELGDPIEINALKTAFQELYRETGDANLQGAHCGLGSVKTNIGHTELAAGVAGVIKVLLQLQHKRLVRSLHCDKINPYIDLKGSPFYIVQDSNDWAAFRDSGGETLPRRAGVSSFGFGGANAHVILEEYIPEKTRGPRESLAIDPVKPRNRPSFGEKSGSFVGLRGKSSKVRSKSGE